MNLQKINRVESNEAYAVEKKQREKRVDIFTAHLTKIFLLINVFADNF